MLLNNYENLADLEDQQLSDDDSEANSDDLADAFDIPMDGATDHKMDVDMPEKGAYLYPKKWLKQVDL